MDCAPAERVHGLMMDFVRISGILQPDQVLSAGPGETASLSQAFAIHELDVNGPLGQGDLAARLSLDKSSASRMAAELARRGLLVRERVPNDRRSYHLVLTDEGRELHKRLAAALHERYERWAAEMRPDELDALVTGLSALVRAMRDEPGAGT
ncbi:DNA-binding MarR family transcriptional regulator [Lipingzhangella halophila]|uniref:DNA-binding MarR family transcriptional regulator n=1 Tax=Lipingzhangella halophila TaxID=1783352 RepID=A0A7W7W6M1_9ACTN|nr:MarR family transcriptional regulator [Lipingzhangella halophila]MBB4934980.1 DNA-binding MarR family transcriptional regulator [Lipingzhangella halophila]